MIVSLIQAVVGGEASSAYPVWVGVPLGSILGPTLFLLYVNGACKVLPDGIVPAVCGDDTTVYAHLPSSDTADAVCSKLQTGVNALAE